MLVERDPVRAIAEIDSVAALAGQAHAELRAVIDGLAPPDLAASGLVGSLRSYAVLVGRTYGKQVRVQATDLPELGEPLQTAVYRIAQEAVSNALRHSGSPQVTVRLTARRRGVLLEVADDGSGFDPASAHQGVGLASMRERASSVGGTLSVISLPGEGTTVRLAVPVRATGRGAS